MHRILRTTCERCGARMALYERDAEQRCMNGHSSNPIMGPVPRLPEGHTVITGIRGANTYYAQAALNLLKIGNP